MQRLEQKYRPTTISAFVGLDKPKRIFSNLLRRPRPCALLCEGPTGVGKTAMGLAFAAELPGSLIHIPAGEFTVDRVREITREVHDYHPPVGKFWVALADEFDQASSTAQVAMLSNIDGTTGLHAAIGGHSEAGDEPNVIWILTTNCIENLERRLVGRCLNVPFSNYGVAQAFADRLRAIWQAEALGAPEPNYARIVKEANNSMRESLNRLDLMLLEA
jgi:DNA polymerase III delta prime subunit